MGKRKQTPNGDKIPQNVDKIPIEDPVVLNDDVDSPSYGLPMTKNTDKLGDGFPVKRRG